MLGKPDRRARIEEQSVLISVKLSNVVEVSVNGQRDATGFRQTYSADGLNVSAAKHFRLVTR